MKQQYKFLYLSLQSPSPWSINHVYSTQARLPFFGVGLKSSQRIFGYLRQSSATIAQISIPYLASKSPESHWIRLLVSFLPLLYLLAAHVTPSRITVGSTREKLSIPFWLDFSIPCIKFVVPS